MKVYYLFSILLVVFSTILAENINFISKKDGANSKVKRAETSDECKYVNNWIGMSESYNCCNYFYVKCKNGHIINM